MATTTRKRSSKKEEILKTAARMFREKGYAGTSMRDLAEKIGIEAASLYNHIHSKSEILEEIIFSISRDCREQLDNMDPSGTSLQKIESLIRFHTKMMIDHFESYSVMVSEWMHLDEEKLGEFVSERRRYVKKIESIVQQGIDGKEFKPVLPYVVVLNILSSVRGLEFWQKSAKTHSAEVMEENMVQHLIGGLKL
ncbi:TetR/AcrR family transcriptional regulator [Niabella drilacis]|uniref:Transcriptional regulator, TetR family n=1 Tax=Niabella drilacis (strain DSM 25811 / CCM 8410 / CCUG 62505 / LMG 26954 / E90) TaxID=1285928 RepID=A0A1G6Q7K8_NIADE|nr:TetR/AcrR family transcriptional regulator [Niabella drilacis]SDC88323.1 transcriptional regulator, TetR family [Niabella drilacis]